MNKISTYHAIVALTFTMNHHMFCHMDVAAYADSYDKHTATRVKNIKKIHKQMFRILVMKGI